MDVIKTQTRFSVRRAEKSDRQQLAGLTHFGAYVHCHLGWASPLDWLGRDSFLVLEKDDRVVAALAFPADYPRVAWLQLFAVSTGISVEEAWELLWFEALDRLDQDTFVIALPLQNWFKKLLQEKNFSAFGDVIMLERDNNNQLDLDPLSATDYHVREMSADDLEAVHALDAEAFDPVWRHSLALIEAIFQDVTIATVVENQQGILGYQMSTEHIERGHLARLAVHPRVQRSGVGTALVLQLIQCFQRRGIASITVNTQVENMASQALYKKLGFSKTDEIYTTYHARV